MHITTIRRHLARSGRRLMRDRDLGGWYVIDAAQNAVLFWVSRPEDALDG